MPNYKIVDSDYLDDGLKIIADSIKAKSGITGDLAFPNEIKEAADSITASNVIDNVEIALDFSNGDMTERLPEGYSVSSATILKPENLTPENIAKDVNIAGIVGTHEGGGSVEGTATVTFCNYDGSVLYTRLVFIGDDCANPVTQGKLDTPTRASDVQYNYTFSGWSDTQGGTASSTVLNNITEDKTVYATYTTSVRYYTARFFDGDTLRETLTVAYGQEAQPSTDKSEHIFVSWTPSDLTIYGDTDFYGTWNESALLEDASWARIAEYAASGEAETRYTLGDTKKITLTWADGTTETVTAQLVGFNHDKADLQDNNSATLPLSFIIKDTVNKSIAWNTNKVNIGWGTSSSYTWYNNELFNALPTDLQAVIKEASKECPYYYGSAWKANYAKSKCWMPSVNELLSVDAVNSELVRADGSPYALFESATKAIRKNNATSKAVEYLTRSRRPDENNANYSICTITTSGTVYAAFSNYTSNSGYVVFGFCI